jgi:hypothetical protein
MYATLVNNPGIASKAEANLARLTPAMRKTRPDYVKYLQIVAKGGLSELLRRVQKAGGSAASLGLPAVLAAMLPDDDQ